jgi:hypothetical protein
MLPSYALTKERVEIFTISLCICKSSTCSLFIALLNHVSEILHQLTVQLLLVASPPPNYKV